MVGGHFGGIFSDCFKKLWPDGLGIREKALPVQRRKLKPWFETEGLSNRAIIQ